MRRVWCSYRHSHRGARCSSRWKLITQIDRPGVDILVQLAEHDAGILPSGAQIVDIVVDRFVEHIAEAALIGRVALGVRIGPTNIDARSEEHTSELQSLMRISYAVFCLKKKNNNNNNIIHKPF